MKNKTVAVLLAFFLGGLGAHHFYMERWGRGVLYLVFFWTYIPAFLGVIDAIIYLVKGDPLFAEESSYTSSANYAPPQNPAQPQQSEPRAIMNNLSIGEIKKTEPEKVIQSEQEEGLL